MKQQKEMQRTKTFHEQQIVKHRNQRSLPKLVECKTSRYSEHVSPLSKPKNYNQWYIPYEKRFMKYQEQKNLNEELKSHYCQFKENPLFIYNNLNKPIHVDQDPFKKPDKEMIEKQHKYDKTKIFLEMNKSSQILRMFLEDLIIKKQRVPAFLKNQQLVL